MKLAASNTTVAFVNEKRDRYDLLGSNRIRLFQSWGIPAVSKSGIPRPVPFPLNGPLHSLVFAKLRTKWVSICFPGHEQIDVTRGRGRWREKGQGKDPTHI